MKFFKGMLTKKNEMKVAVFIGLVKEKLAFQPASHISYLRSKFWPKKIHTVDRATSLSWPSKYMHFQVEEIHAL